MIRYYYGNLKDATITAGDVGVVSQYPITNINYLSKNLYTQLDDTGSETTAIDHYIDLIMIDFGSSQSNILSSVIDLSGLYINLESSTYNIEEIAIELLGSNDDITYTKFGDYFSDTNALTTYETTLSDVYTDTFIEQTYRYYKVRLYVGIGTTDTLDWEISGNINNLYIGNYIELPSPEFIPKGFVHKTTIAEAFGGARFGIDTQGKRKTWGFTFNNLDEVNEEDYDAFDTVNKQGVIPCYMENICGTTILIDPTFVRVYANDTWQEIAYKNYTTTHQVEEEL